MAREIKFRAWDKKNKEMAEVIDIHFGDKCLTVMCEKYDAVLCRASKTFELMQYVGLKDKNGVEIYEGDIVKDVCVREDKKPVYWRIAIRKGAWMMEIDHWTRTDYLFGRVHTVEVVGNIFENPELLKNNK